MFHLLYLLCTSLIFHPQRQFGSFHPIKQQPGAARGQHLEAIIASRDDLDPFMDSMDEMSLDPPIWGNGWDHLRDTWTDENLRNRGAPVDRWISRFLRYNAGIFRCSGMWNDQS